MVTSVCVFCGSSKGASSKYSDLVERVGRFLAQQKVTLVYGGASIGLMGIIAESALNCGGQVIGVIPNSIASREIAHQNLTKMHYVESMHERKKLMYQLSDAFIALPGGFGTLDELFEIITWKQLGLHKKPIFLVNSDHYFSDLIQFLQSAHKEGFIFQSHLHLFDIVSDLDELKHKLSGN